MPEKLDKHEKLDSDVQDERGARAESSGEAHAGAELLKRALARAESPREARARAVAEAGSLEAALEKNRLEQFQDISVSEALVLGLLNQNVRTFIGIFGHGSTDIAEVLRVYQAAGLLRMCNVRHETEASHAAAQLRWQYGQRAAVITSIGPGALHAFAGSLLAASNGLGIYYIFGDETTHNEGPNMQQVPRREQNLFARITSGMGGTYTLTEPRSVFTALKWGFAATRNPAREQPFFLLVPMNSQPRIITGCNLDELPRPRPIPRSRGMETAQYSLAAELIAAHERVVVKTGGGARDISPEVLKRLLDLTHAVYVHGPNVPGLLPDSDPRNMTVGGSKGSISGNYAMEHADLLIAVGARGVCQWDSSGTAWKTVKQVISINSDPADILQYNRTLPLPGDAELVISRLNEELEKKAVPPADAKMAWLTACRQQRLAWDAFCRERWEHPVLTDPTSGQTLLTQPAAIRAVIDFADAHGAVKIFDAGDVQANGFQALHDQRPGQTYNDTGSSYMGFAVSALLASALVETPEYPIAFTGDGSFMMNPQILIDGVEHGLRGMIVLFDNRRMAAISALQKAQYGDGAEFATSDTVAVNYLQLASAVSGIHAVSGGSTIESLSNALLSAYAHPGLSLVHVPVYYGDDPLGGLGVFGSWNVGNWCGAVEEEKHRIGL